MKGTSKRTSGNLLSPLGAQNKNTGAALQTLLTECAYVCDVGWIFQAFYINTLPCTSRTYEWLIQPRWLLTLQLYVPLSDGTTSLKGNTYFQSSKYRELPFLSLNGFPFLYHATLGVGYPSAEQSSFAEFPTGRAISFCWSLSFGTVNLGATAKRQGRYTQTPGKRPSKMRRLSGRFREVLANEKRPQGFSSEKMSDVRWHLLDAGYDMRSSMLLLKFFEYCK